MDIDFLYDLASQLDRKTFMKVHSLLENKIKHSASDNLLDVLDKYRKGNLMTLEEISKEFGVQKQSYNQWFRGGKIPSAHVPKAAKMLNLTKKEAMKLNFVKEYNTSKKISIPKLLGKKRIALSENKKTFVKRLGVDIVTYRYWRNAGRVPDERLKTISEFLDINIDEAIEINTI